MGGGSRTFHSKELLSVKISLQENHPGIFGHLMLTPTVSLTDVFLPQGLV